MYSTMRAPRSAAITKHWLDPQNRREFEDKGKALYSFILSSLPARIHLKCRKIHLPSRTNLNSSRISIMRSINLIAFVFLVAFTVAGQAVQPGFDLANYGVRIDPDKRVMVVL